jgi:phospholipase C
MSDNSFDTVFGPSTPGALNLVSGQTHGATITFPAGSTGVPGNAENGTVIGDPDPALAQDDCTNPKRTQVTMSGKNIGDLLNAANVTWGFFTGGFTPTSFNNGIAVCGSSHTSIGGVTIGDYIPHHEPFQYYPDTANPHHLPPTSVAMIGHSDQANHQYDLTSFWAAADHGNMPAVSWLKAPAFQDGHAGYSDPLDEQTFLVNTINHLQHLPSWKHTAVVIEYDDSDGWYDHVMPPVVSHSNDPLSDALTGAGSCGTPAAGAFEDRCGYGPRLPLLVISPWAKHNFVDHTLTDQTSTLRFIEDNWLHGARIDSQSFDNIAGSLANMFDFHHQSDNTLMLNPTTGEVTNHGD